MILFGVDVPGGGGFMPKDGFEIVEFSPPCCSMGQFANWGL